MITVLKSRNAKTGKVAASYRGKHSCPKTCAAYNSCYAKTGPVNIVFSRAEESKDDAAKISEFIASLPANYKMRHHTAGDLLNAKQKPDMPYINSLIGALKARLDLITWGYTHAWKSFERNPFKGIASVNFNASCDTFSEIKEAKQRGFDTVVIVPENATPGIYEGERVIICPAQMGKGEVTCDKCQLCSKKDRAYSIGFRLHGALKNRHQFEQGDVQEKLAA